MIFRISDKPFFIDNPEALAIPEFKNLGDEGMKYICLVYGYNSPFRKMDLNDRKYKSIDLCGIKRTPTGRPSKLETDLIELRSPFVINAITLYKEIQFDEDRDTLEAYDEQIAEFKALMRKKDKSDKQLDQALKVSKDIIALMETRKKLVDILDVRNEEEFSSSSIDIEDMSSNSSMIESFLDKQ